MNKQQSLKKIPSVGIILEKPFIKELLKDYSRTIVVEAVRKVLADIRKKISNSSKVNIDIISDEYLRGKIEEELKDSGNTGLHRVINASGIILHTGLGRAVLSKQAVNALSMLDGCSALQIDVKTGKRSLRDEHIEEIICKVTGAEAATVVNNNAAATMIVLNTLAEGKEAVVSRGQLIEIGGEFRLPEIMKKSNAVLREIGSTNKTHLRDYENAISENTGLLLHVHTSNYKIVGFTKEVPITELVKLGKKYNVPVVDDIGSGALIDLSKYGFTKEPTVQESIKAGADLVLFSADKFIGGPQGGIIIGKKQYVEKIRKNPLARVMRVGKLTLAALRATLFLFLDEKEAIKNIPTYQMLMKTSDDLKKQASRLMKNISAVASKDLKLEIDDDFSEMGSGSLPIDKIPTKVIKAYSDKLSAEKLIEKLRTSHPIIFARIKGNKVLLDARTIHESEEKDIVKKFSILFPGA